MGPKGATDLFTPNTAERAKTSLDLLHTCLEGQWEGKGKPKRTTNVGPLINAKPIWRPNKKYDPERGKAAAWKFVRLTPSGKRWLKLRP